MQKQEKNNGEKDENLENRNSENEELASNDFPQSPSEENEGMLDDLLIFDSILALKSLIEAENDSNIEKVIEEVEELLDDIASKGVLEQFADELMETLLKSKCTENKFTELLNLFKLYGAFEDKLKALESTGLRRNNAWVEGLTSEKTDEGAQKLERTTGYSSLFSTDTRLIPTADLRNVLGKSTSTERIDEVFEETPPSPSL